MPQHKLMQQAGHQLRGACVWRLPGFGPLQRQHRDTLCVVSCSFMRPACAPGAVADSGYGTQRFFAYCGTSTCLRPPLVQSSQVHMTLSHTACMRHVESSTDTTGTGTDNAWQQHTLATVTQVPTRHTVSSSQQCMRACTSLTQQGAQSEAQQAVTSSAKSSMRRCHVCVIGQFNPPS
jgi:hypothetical protein